MLLTRPPLSKPRISFSKLLSIQRFTPFDLHVLGAPPAFVLSQDQTLYSLYIWHLAVLNIILTSILIESLAYFSSRVFL